MNIPARTFSIVRDEINVKPQTRDLLRDSSLYRQFQAQREEILKHKRIESKKVGRDISFEEALMS